MITYQEIYDILRKEKYSENLQKINPEFFDHVREYLKEKRKILSKEKESFFKDTLNLTRKQLENTLAIIKEIITIREKKILNLAFTAAKTGVSKKDTENLLHQEKKLFETIVKEIEKCDKAIVNLIEKEEKKDLKNILVRFKDRVPSVYDMNGEELGPFDRDEIATLPREIGEILIKEGKAEEILQE